MKRKIGIWFMVMVLVIGISYSTGTVQAKTALNKKKLTLTVGKTATLKLKGIKKKPKWTSSNKKVATVTAKGKVKAKKVGKATITAKLGKKKYKCKVTVKKKATSAKTTENATTEETTETETATPSSETKNYDAGEYSITKKHSGEATYYDRENPGAANLDYLEDTYYTAAMNNYDYMNGLAGAYIEITDKDGDKINVVITDRLPEGAKGDIDLSRKSFAKIEPLVTGRMAITWKIIPFPTAAPISYVFKPTSSEYWAEVQVRNGRYPIKKLEYYDKSAKKYVALERKEYNYFAAESGMGEGPYTFRVTDFYGHVLTDSGIAINTTEKPVKGKANFPY